MAASCEDIMGLPVGELRKRLDQQKRLLLNRALLTGLPDGGERLRRKVAELESAISSKQGLEETMEQLSRMHLGEDKGRVEGSKAEKKGGKREVGGEKGEGKTTGGGQRKFVDLQAALGGHVEPWDSDDEDVTADSNHKPSTKSPDRLPVQQETEVRLGMETRELQDVSSDTQLKTDQEKLAAVRQRIQKDSPRRAQALSIDQSLALQVDQQRREEELRTESAAMRLMESVGTMTIGMPPTAGRGQYRDTAVNTGQEEEEGDDGDSVSDPSDLSSGEDDLVGEEIHF